MALLQQPAPKMHAADGGPPLAALLTMQWTTMTPWVAMTPGVATGPTTRPMLWGTQFSDQTRSAAAARVAAAVRMR